ncbi:MAG: amidohydrolase family protein [Coriobacteriia bacterium]
MIIAGDWLLAPGARVIPNGAVLINGSRVVAVGTRTEMLRLRPRDVVRDHPGCIVTPGFVNAHTHLCLTSLAGLVPSAPFPEWLARVARAARSLDADDLEAGATAGAIECLRCGVTVVGDVAYGPESPAAAGDVGLGGAFFWEVLGIGGADLKAHLADHDYPDDPETQCMGRTRCGLSPHAPYTARAELITAVAEFARVHGVPFAMHIAESCAEAELLSSGTGPLVDVAERLAPGFRPPGHDAVRYAARLGALDGMIAVHCVHLEPGSSELLARSTAGVVLCPRSNRFLHNGDADVEALRLAGARLAIGTDSLASNADLDVFNEARALRELDPALTDRDLILMLTEHGAHVLGLGERFGTLAEGAYADVVVSEVGVTDDPLGALIADGGRNAVRSVISAGIWRVVDGEIAFRTAGLDTKIARAADKAARAIDRAVS